MIYTAEIYQELERLRRYDEELSKVMPPDFKDWHQNSKDEWPTVARLVIENLQKSTTPVRQNSPKTLNKGFKK